MSKDYTRTELIEVVTEALNDLINNGVPMIDVVRSLGNVLNQYAQYYDECDSYDGTFHGARWFDSPRISENEGSPDEGEERAFSILRMVGAEMERISALDPSYFDGGRMERSAHLRALSRVHGSIQKNFRNK